jgi:hypothetical protein
MPEPIDPDTLPQDFPDPTDQPSTTPGADDEGSSFPDPTDQPSTTPGDGGQG